MWFRQFGLSTDSRASPGWGRRGLPSVAGALESAIITEGAKARAPDFLSSEYAARRVVRSRPARIWGVSSGGKKHSYRELRCQMKFHDSEKVTGSLITQGYRQVSRKRTPTSFFRTPARSGTRPSRGFHRLAEFKRLRRGKGVCGHRLCGTAGGGADLRARAPCFTGGRLRSAAICRRCWCRLSAASALPGLNDRNTEETSRPSYGPHQPPPRIYHDHRRMR